MDMTENRSRRRRGSNGDWAIFFRLGEKVELERAVSKTGKRAFVLGAALGQGKSEIGWPAMVTVR